MDKHDENVRKLAWARIDAQKKQEPHDALARAVMHAVGLKDLRLARLRDAGAPLQLERW